MYFQVNMCCLCLDSSADKLHHLKDTGDPSDVSYYEKINFSLSKLDIKNEYTEDYVLCWKCCYIIDKIYEFSNRSIINMDIMTHYLTLLSSPRKQRSQLVVDLSDCCNEINIIKKCIKLQDTVTSKVTDAMVHNTVRVCETRQENGDIIIHQSNDAYVSTVKMVNYVVTDSCVDVIDIKEELDIKIEEPEVVADYLKHAYEFRSDFNNTHTYNEGCSKLEDATTGVTDVMVHDNVPVSDSLQDNDGVKWYQWDNDYVVTAGNDVEVECKDGKVEEVCIETKENADGTPGSPADPMNAAADALQPCDEENSSIGDPAATRCNTSSDLTELTPTGTKKLVQGYGMCDKKSPRKSNLRRQRRIHTGEKPYVCEVCNKEFNKKGNLAVHKRTHTGEKLYLCEVCDKGFSNGGHLVIHKRIHTGEKPYVCKVCNIGFNIKGNLAVHKRTHTGEKPYLCEVCNKGFSNGGHLVVHKRIHTGEKPYVCKVCNIGFNIKGNLVVHKRTHTGEKPYLCELCNKAFSHRSALVRHKRKHTGERSYLCEVCNKAFTQNISLIIHKRIHTGEKPFMCEVCNKGFTKKDCLTKHRRIHTGEKPYVCEVCNKGFIRKGDLAIHKRMHTGEKPYVCEVCKKGFTQKSVLVTHKRMHTGEKPYVCNVCNKGFTWNSALIRHKCMQTG